ncbi:MAG: hypothetical protein JWL61_1589 [Gemmatimonadetes bacterium]|nr:hypothetical protein [Gemmatimonadota bacterium]
MPNIPLSRHIPRVGLLAIIAAVAACSSSGVSPVPSDGKVPLGTWGGDNAGMIVGDSAMHLHVGCTYGDVSGRIAVDANGNFDVAGNYLLRAYPIAVGPALPARFVGHIDGGTATVTVTVNDTVEHTTVVKGPVVVQQGEQPRLGPCPICRRPDLTKRGA